MCHIHMLLHIVAKAEIIPLAHLKDLVQCMQHNFPFKAHLKHTPGGILFSSVKVRDSEASAPLPTPSSLFGDNYWFQILKREESEKNVCFGGLREFLPQIFARGERA